VQFLGTIEDCPFEKLPEDQKFEELSEEILELVLEEIRGSGEKVLFIMDDVVNDMKKDARLERLLSKVLITQRRGAQKERCRSVSPCLRWRSPLTIYRWVTTRSRPWTTWAAAGNGWRT
jgi:hypothetical protein